MCEGLLKAIYFVICSVSNFKIMQNIPRSVSITTAVFIFFLFVCGFDEATDIVLFLFTLLNIMVVWMVYSVLKFEYTAPYTFQERFYEDVDNKRIKDVDE